MAVGSLLPFPGPELSRFSFPAFLSLPSRWLTKSRRTFKSWITLLVPFLYCCTVIGNYGIQYFELFLKSRTKPDGSQTWTTAQVNAIPMGGRAIQILFVWIWAILSDYLQIRWQLIVAQTVFALVPTIMMSVWTTIPDQVPDTAAYASYFMNFMVLGTAPLLFSWLADMYVSPSPVAFDCIRLIFW